MTTHRHPRKSVLGDDGWLCIDCSHELDTNTVVSVNNVFTHEHVDDLLNDGSPRPALGDACVGCGAVYVHKEVIPGLPGIRSWERQPALTSMSQAIDDATDT